MGLRRQAREVALQGVFMCDFHSKWNREELQFCFEHFGVLKPVQPYAERLALGVIDHISAIDSELTRASEHWSITRMSRVDRSILRVAAYEILLLEDVPHSVAMNEAIEIAKRFGSDESPGFINGVLDKLATNHLLTKGIVRERAKPQLVISNPAPSEASSESVELSEDELLEKVLIG